MSKQTLSKSNGFQVSLESAKDYLAHKKFTKASKLCFEGEVPRSAFPKGRQGPYGWIQWRMQFTPRQGEDMTPVENELNRLHDQRKLTDDEYARLRGLYGLDGHVTAQVPPLIITQPPSAGFCVNCGAQIMPGKQFCGKCGAPVTPAEVPPSTITEPPPRSSPQQQSYPSTQPPTVQTSKSGVLGALLNFLFPGLGYWYLGYRKVLGIHPVLFLIGIWIVDVVIFYLISILSILSLLISLFVAYDAYVKAKGKPGWLSASS